MENTDKYTNIAKAILYLICLVLVLVYFVIPLIKCNRAIPKEMTDEIEVDFKRFIEEPNVRGGNALNHTTGYISKDEKPYGVEFHIYHDWYRIPAKCEATTRQTLINMAKEYPLDKFYSIIFSFYDDNRKETLVYTVNLPLLKVLNYDLTGDLYDFVDVINLIKK